MFTQGIIIDIGSKCAVQANKNKYSAIFRLSMLGSSEESKEWIS